jgi:hypothetical protein
MAAVFATMMVHLPFVFGTKPVSATETRIVLRTLEGERIKDRRQVQFWGGQAAQLVPTGTIVSIL